MSRESIPEARGSGFAKGVRLRKRREFLAVQQTGTKFHGRHFLAVVAGRASIGHEDDAQGRVGITVSKKVGNAVTRNRIKRLVREYVRRSDWLGLPFDVVVIAKHNAAGLAGYDAAAIDLSRIGEQIRARMRRSPC